MTEERRTRDVVCELVVVEKRRARRRRDDLMVIINFVNNEHYHLTLLAITWSLLLQATSLSQRLTFLS